MVQIIIVVVTRLNELFLLVILLLLCMLLCLLLGKLLSMLLGVKTIVAVIWKFKMWICGFVEHYGVATCVKVLRLLHRVKITGGVLIGMLGVLGMLGMLYIVIMLIIIIIISLSFWVLALNELRFLVIIHFIFYPYKLWIKLSLLSVEMIRSRPLLAQLD